MRHLLCLTAFAVLLTLNGCRSCTTMPSPIVGDSMCHWGATTNSSQPCQPQSINFRGALAKFLGGGGTSGPACCASDKYNDFSNEPCGGCGCQGACCCGMAAGCGTGACGSGRIMAMPGPTPFSYSGGMSSPMQMGFAQTHGHVAVRYGFSHVRMRWFDLRRYLWRSLWDGTHDGGPQ